MLKNHIFNGNPSKVTKIFFLAALALHILYIVSLPSGLLAPLFVEGVEGYGQGSDFFGIYQAGSNLLNGYSIYETNSVENEAHRVVPFFYFYRYLPPAAFLSAVVTLVLSPWPAYWFLVVFNEVLIMAVVFSLLAWKRWNVRRRWIMASLWLGYFPVYIEQFMGQFSILMAVLLYIIWRYDSPAAPTTDPYTNNYSFSADSAGPAPLLGSWAASIILKSFSVLLVIPFLRDRLFKRILAAFSIVATLSLLYFFFRPSDLMIFAKLNLTPFPTIYKGNFGFQAFLKSLFSQLPSAWASPLAKFAAHEITPAKILLLAISGVIIILATFATLRLRSLKYRRAMDLLLWTTVFFLIFKSIWEYHLVMILPAITAIYLVTGSRTVLVTGLLLGLPTLFPVSALFGIDKLGEFNAWPVWFQIPHLGVKSIPVLTLFIWSLNRIFNTGNIQNDPVDG